MGGLHAALDWAREGEDGVFLLACDLPLVGPTLVGGILERWRRDIEALVPESPGPLGVEPLCGVYSVRCLPALEACLGSGNRALMALLARVKVETVPMSDLGQAEDLAVSFHNVNTAQDRDDVEAILTARGASLGLDPKGGRTT
jgi:molybdopterin-guanine dinucleotide biosynthesis protein A